MILSCEWDLLCSNLCTSLCRGGDLGSSLQSAATCRVWKMKDAEDLIELCGGLTRNMKNIFEV